MEKKNILEDEVQQALLIESITMFMPDFPKFYPKIIGIFETIDKAIDSFLGDEEKMIVITQKYGAVLFLVIDRKKVFTLNNEANLEGTENPVISKFEKTEWKNKILNSTALQILKEKYEKTLTGEEKEALVNKIE